ncbi:MAG: adenine phosphoribosyltransferase [Deltaproteobacteria bacterium]|nr:MAG: adenine phosphoribosyltransferase [Deltaproteobacteria bacterium]
MNVLHAKESGDKHRFSVEGLDYDIEIPFVTLNGTNGPVRIASLNLVGQIRLNIDLGRLLAQKVLSVVGNMDGLVILTVVEKALQLAQVLAMELGVDSVAVAYNRVKPHMEAHCRPLVQVGTDSITSGSKFLAVYERDLNLLLQARGILLLDDVVSSGGTILGLAELLEEVALRRGGEAPKIEGIFCVAQEGDTHPLLPAPLYALTTLPKPVCLKK